MVQTNHDSKDFSRRKFLKGGVILGATTCLYSLSGSKNTTEGVVKAIGKKELDAFPHEISPDFERYAENRNTFMKKFANIDMSKMDMSKMDYSVLVSSDDTDDSKIGHTTLDVAFGTGAKAIDRQCSSIIYTWDKKPASTKYEFESIETATKAVKRAAKFYGADLVGITAYDEKWVYNPINKGFGGTVYDTDFPFKPISVIVMAVEMDYETMSGAPTELGSAATGLGYSNMVEVTAKVSEFIRQLGYNAFACGNDTAESVPYAIAAGLGEQGRQGLLITYEYGPRVRICKVFTEMELVHDKPIEFGANEFCRVCKKCAENCPSQSISHETEMTWKGATDTISNHTGVLKYYVDVDGCYAYWDVVGTGCSVCIAVCPYNKPDFWHHKITTALTATPLKPFLNEMDDLFGYGNVFDEQTVIDFWGIGDYSK